MGDRANVFVRNATKENPKAGVYLYTHWRGHELAETVQTALKSPAGQCRLADESYLTRIIFCAMVRGDGDEETGYGISSFLSDNEHPIIVVDCEARRVWLASEDDLLSPYEGAAWSMADFMALETQALNAIYWNGRRLHRTPPAPNAVS